mmetsp:Transcript_21187/g.42760  ORF Transcript_21187/g.42760 Transcript_21187/m.42760 type:complete len:206 (-) Transcript_21187:1111-1728(-)
MSKLQTQHPSPLSLFSLSGFVIALLGIYSSGHNTNTHTPFQPLVICTPKYDVGIWVSYSVSYKVCCTIYLKESHVCPTSDIDKHTLGRTNIKFIPQKGIAESPFSSTNSTVVRGTPFYLHVIVLQTCLSCPQHSIPHPMHDTLYVGKIKINQAGCGHQVRDRTHSSQKNIISHGKRVNKRCLWSSKVKQVLVWNSNQGVNYLGEA